MAIDLMSLGWDATFASAYARFDRPDHGPARVAGIDRGICTVFGAHGADRASLGGAPLARAARDPVELPCVGDWVAVRRWPDRRATIEAVLPRRTRMAHVAAGESSFGQVLAANLDTVAVVEALTAEPEPGRVPRLLAFVRDSGARPLLVLTKADLVDDPGAVVARIAGAVPGVPVLVVSGRTGAGVAELRAVAGCGRTLGLLGAPGTGKSTLVSALAQVTMLATRCGRWGAGRRGTTSGVLVALPGGGAVLDTQGWPAPRDGGRRGRLDVDRPA